MQLILLLAMLAADPQHAIDREEAKLLKQLQRSTARAMADAKQFEADRNKFAAFCEAKGQVLQMHGYGVPACMAKPAPQPAPANTPQRPATEPATEPAKATQQ